MLDHFTSRKQKTDCIEAIKNSLEVWKSLTPWTLDKIDAVYDLIALGVLPEGVPEYGCHLCEYVKKQSDASGSRQCEMFCPVIWDKENNPENHKDGTTPPCCAKTSPYHEYENICDDEEYYDSTDEDYIEKTLEEVRTLLRNALERARMLPVGKETP